MKKLLAYLMTLTVLCASLAVPASAFNPFKGKGESSASGASQSASAPQSEASDASSSKASSKGSSSAPEKQKADPKKSSSAGISATVGNFPPSFADQLTSQSVYMLNLDSDTVVWEKDAQKRIYPASLTKIMTAIVTLESGIDIETETTSLKAYIQNYLYNLGGAQVGGIYLNETLTIKDLLYATMVQSACEAAMMVADYVGDGDIDYFVEMMNKKAKEIGANNTHFSNSTGLHDEQNYSTAYDMALIAKYAMKLPGFMEMAGTNVYTSAPTDKHPSGITWYTSNSMQIPTNEYYYEGLKGLKTGTLDEQNVRNFVSTATRDGYSYLLVVMGAPYYDAAGAKYTKNIAFGESAALYDWAFQTFRVKTLINVGKEVSQVGVRLSWDDDYVKLLAKEKFATLVPNEVAVDDVIAEPVIEKGIELPVKGQKGKTMAYLDAPIQKGQEVGYVKLTVAGEEVGRVTLVAAKNIEQSKALYYWEKVKEFFSTFIFKFVLTFVVVVLILYIVLMVIRNRNRRRYQNRRRR